MEDAYITKDTVIVRYIIIGMNVVVALVPVVIYVLSHYRIGTVLTNITSASTVFTFALEILLIVLGKKHDKKVELCIFGKRKGDVLKEISPSSRNELEKARDEMRQGLTIIAIVAIASLVVCLFLHWVRINICIALISGLAIAFIYADYLPHAKRYLVEYDTLFAKAGKANETDGLARIYFEEYQKCGLKRRASKYKEWDEEAVYIQEKDDEKVAKDYISCVFGIRAVMKNQTLGIIMWVMLVLTLVTVEENFWGVFLQWIEDEDIYNCAFVMVSLLAPIVFMGVSICQLYESYEENFLIYKLWGLMNKQKLDDMIVEYNKLVNKGIRGKQCKIRGRFVYSQQQIEQYHDISGVPMKYRMRFPDRFVTNMVRYIYTYLLGVLIGCMLLLEIQGITAKALGVYFGAAIVGVVIGILFLPELNRRRIQNACKVLETMQQE